MVNVLTNYRASGPWGGQQVEFREGDRAWPGAAIMELPDLSSVHLEARLDEADRGRLKRRAGCVDPYRSRSRTRVQGHHRAHFGPRQGGLLVRLAAGAQFRARSGARRDRPEDPARHERRGADCHRSRPQRRRSCPSESIFQRDGHPIVYKLDGSEFAEQPGRDLAPRAREWRSSRRASLRATGSRPGSRRRK